MKRTLQLSTALAALGLACMGPARAQPGPDAVGQWEAVIPVGTWGGSSSHLFLLKTKKLLSIPGYFVFDPTNNDKESVPRARIGEEDVKLNCSGHTHLGA